MMKSEKLTMKPRLSQGMPDLALMKSMITSLKVS